MTKLELHRLAGAIATLRPDWPPASLQTFLERHFTHRPLRDIAVALVACALDPDTSTPARVLEPGPWWQMAATRDVPTARNTCPDHPHHGARVDPRTGDRTCAGCWADRNGDTASVTFRRQAPTSEAKRARQALARPLATPDTATTGKDRP